MTPVGRPLRLLLPVLLVTTLGACRSPVTTAPQWVPCGTPACTLLAPAGTRQEARDDGIDLVHEATAIRLSARRLLDVERDDDLDGWLDARHGELALAARWMQTDAPHGFVVRGISGTLPPPAGVLLDEDPQRVHLVVYENPRTGHLLALRLAGPRSRWQEAWPVLSQTLSEVRFGADF